MPTSPASTPGPVVGLVPVGTVSGGQDRAQVPVHVTCPATVGPEHVQGIAGAVNENHGPELSHIDGFEGRGRGGCAGLSSGGRRRGRRTRLVPATGEGNSSLRRRRRPRRTSPGRGCIDLSACTPPQPPRDAWCTANPAVQGDGGRVGTRWRWEPAPKEMATTATSAGTVAPAHWTRLAQPDRVP